MFPSFDLPIVFVVWRKYLVKHKVAVVRTLIHSVNVGDRPLLQLCGGCVMGEMAHDEALVFVKNGNHFLCEGGAQC